jgi:hypothetical protein
MARLTAKRVLKWHARLTRTVDAMDRILAHGRLTEAERRVLRAAATAAETADWHLLGLTELF